MKLQEFYSDESKWIQGSLFDDSKTKACLFGALGICYTPSVVYAQVCSTEPERIAYLAALARLAKSVEDYTGNCSIAKFNDDRSTTFADIRRVIERADV